MTNPHDPGVDPATDLDRLGLFDARYGAFLESLAALRPRLHRYCARMTGSAMDGEDVMQEAVFEAYRKLGQFDPGRELSPWLFRIAHNRCIDFLRRRQVRQEAEAAAAATQPDAVLPVEPAGSALGTAMERLVTQLPPKERSCVLLKDVFDYSLEEIADLVDSTPGGVKAALNRGRSKLDALAAAAPATPVRQADPAALQLLQLYIERFNRRDWDGVRELISADARLRVGDCFAGRFADSPYLGEYQRGSIPWHMATGEVDGELVVMILLRSEQGLAPLAPIRVVIEGGRIVRLADYCKCPWLLQSAEWSVD
jgi:RNA polymerase sigma-70 factor (ECF subfamily)